MKWILILSLTASFSALAVDATNSAQTDQQKQEMLQNAKAEFSKHIDSRITELQTAKTCVASAQDKDALHACGKQMHEQMKANHGDWKQKAQAWKENHQKGSKSPASTQN